MRISAKRLRYTLEIFKVCFPPEMEELLEQARALQELLGEIHDADVLVPFLTDRLGAIAKEDEAALLARLHAETDEEVRLKAIRDPLTPSESDRRLGIYALLGRTLHRRRRRYAQFLDLWAQLETRGFRQRLFGRLHRLIEAERGGRGLEALQRPVEQQHAQLLFQRLDVPAQRRLAVADLASGARQRAFRDHGGEAAPECPVRIGSGHPIHS